jgi:hypothetical protein
MSLVDPQKDRLSKTLCIEIRRLAGDYLTRWV